MKKALVATLTAATLLVATAAPAWSFDRRFATFTINSLSSDLMRVVIQLALMQEQNPPPDCKNDVPVRVQRRKSRRWITVGRGRTNKRARFVVDLNDRSGRYRAVAPAFMTESGSQCFKSVSNTRTHQAQ